MGLIKSINAPSTLTPFSMRDIENQARAIILRARQQAEQLLAAAQVEAEQLKPLAHAQGHEEGFAQGLQAGTEQGRADGHQQALDEHRQSLAQLVATISEMIVRINDERQRLEAEAIGDVVRLAVAIARRVTKRQGELDPRVLQSNLTEAMKLVVGAADVRIAVHPSQKQALSGELPRLRLSWPTLEHVELIEDESLSPGGCRILTHQSQIDADLDVQLDRVVADLLPSPTVEDGSAVQSAIGNGQSAMARSEADHGGAP